MSPFHKSPILLLAFSVPPGWAFLSERSALYLVGAMPRLLTKSPAYPLTGSSSLASPASALPPPRCDMHVPHPGRPSQTSCNGEQSARIASSSPTQEGPLPGRRANPGDSTMAPLAANALGPHAFVRAKERKNPAGKIFFKSLHPRIAVPHYSQIAAGTSASSHHQRRLTCVNLMRQNSTL